MKQLLLLLSLVLLGETGAVANDAFKLSRTTPLKSRSLNISFSQSTVCSPFSDRVVITGLSITGRIEKTSPEYLVRVILKDTTGKEYLVMESYEELNSNTIIDFENYCEETDLLDNIVPDSLKVYIKDATLHIADISTSNMIDEDSLTLSEHRRMRRKCQAGNMIERINAYNKANRRLWVAGETPISIQDYENRKRILRMPERSSSGGIEYYVGGIFEYGHTASYSTSSSLFVDHFDWRDRHGNNWMTPTRDQGVSKFCTVFASIGVTEAMANLYYNRILDLDLSEQEIVDCADSDSHYAWQGFTYSTVINYLRSHGVCDSTAYPQNICYDPHIHIHCLSDSISPHYSARISGYDMYSTEKDGLKKTLISKGPLLSGWDPQSGDGHAMVLVGFNTIHIGDSLFYYDKNMSRPSFISPIEEGDPRIGATYWIFKNSNADYPIEGYYYILFSEKNINNRTYLDGLGIPCSFTTPIIVSNLTDDDIVIEDADSDGYYTWGIGSRPATCPSWIPIMPDGNDADSTICGITEYGQPIYIDYRSPYEIYPSQVYETDWTPVANILISHGYSLTIKAGLVCVGNTYIQMDYFDTELIVDGGVIANADIRMIAPSKLTIKNGGTIYMKKDVGLEIPIGSTLEMDEGSIGGPYKKESHISFP